MVCVYVCGAYVCSCSPCTCTGAGKSQKRALDPLFLALPVVFYFPVWVLSTDPGSSKNSKHSSPPSHLALGLPRIFDLTHKPSFALTITGEDKETNFYFS